MPAKDDQGTPRARAPQKKRAAARKAASEQAPKELDAASMKQLRENLKRKYH
jgi:hypothetical protein